MSKQIRFEANVFHIPPCFEDARRYKADHSDLAAVRAERCLIFAK